MMPYISESNIKPIEAAWLSVCIRGGAPLWSKSIYHWIITLTKRMSPSCHSTQTHTIFHIKFTAFFVCACVSRLPKDGEGRIKMEGNTRIFYLRIELIEDEEREREREPSHILYRNRSGVWKPLTSVPTPNMFSFDSTQLQTIVFHFMFIIKTCLKEITDLFPSCARSPFFIVPVFNAAVCGCCCCCCFFCLSVGLCDTALGMCCVLVWMLVVRVCERDCFCIYVC